MMAGTRGMAPGTTRASGRTTSELRVPALKATARPASGVSPASRETAHPMSGASTEKAT